MSMCCSFSWTEAKESKERRRRRRGGGEWGGRRRGGGWWWKWRRGGGWVIDLRFRGETLFLWLTVTAAADFVICVECRLCRICQTSSCHRCEARWHLVYSTFTLHTRVGSSYRCAWDCLLWQDLILLLGQPFWDILQMTVMTSFEHE